MKGTVLITGGSGYVGGRIAAHLLKNGCGVVVGTRQKAASPAWLAGASVRAMDWASADSLKNACSGVEAVIHLAAMNEIESAKHPVAALEANTKASLMLLEASISAGVKRFIYFSTAHVYGAPLQGVIHEGTLPRPIHPYALTHKFSEDFVLAAHSLGRVQGAVFRLSNGFGAPTNETVDRWTLLVNDLCRQAATNGVLKLQSDGMQWRDFITLTDVARATHHILHCDPAQWGDGLFNLGGQLPMTVFAMASRVAMRWQALTGRPIDIIRVQPAGGELPALDYRCDKLIATGFTLTSPVDEEIDNTLRFCLQTFGTKS